MKCIRCQHDSKYRERSNGKCPKCRGEFAFEPRGGDPVTDMLFKSAIDGVSAHGSLRWGVENLYYEVCRRKRWIGCIGLLTLGLIRAPLVSLDLVRFNRLWDRWCKVYGTPEGVIVRRAHPRTESVESDIGDYSFDRAVICDRARTVDLLLANNFHFENNCAVLSQDGYPPGPFATVCAMLKRNPRLEAFVLHDATPKGCELAHQLANDPAWFAGQVAVVDVGLRPEHAGPFRGLLLPAKEQYVSANVSIRPQEAAWLSRYILEVAAIRPEQILKRLFRAINRKPAAEDSGTSGGDGGGVFYDGGSFGKDAGHSDGVGDSFG